MFCKDSDMKVELKDVEEAVLPNGHNEKSAKMKLTQYYNPVFNG